jgi:pyruvate,orthophosphate dikinase
MKRLSPATTTTLTDSLPALLDTTDAALPAPLVSFGLPGSPRVADVSPRELGFKAYNLLRMAELGLPVPPGFVLGTAWCTAPRSGAPRIDASVWRSALTRLERSTGLGLGDVRRPLLVSVRSGAPVSMPGMMQTLLNIGLSDRTLPGFIRLTGHPRLAWDAYRRLVATYGETVAGIDPELFEAELHIAVAGSDERRLDFAELRSLTERLLVVYRQACGREFPQDPAEQLAGAIEAVFASWQSAPARAYRAMHGIADDLGTAVTVQQMVFGNAGGVSGAGVGFSRDPTHGAPAPWVDFLFHAQGEDVVSGRRSAHGHQSLAGRAPAVWASLCEAVQRLEVALGDMQDFEFTVQDGRLYLLQTRNGKRSLIATARIALDLCDDGRIDAAEAQRRTAALTRTDLMLTRLVGQGGAAAATEVKPLAQAASAQAGVVSGEIVLDEARARERHAASVPLILVRRDAETRDLSALELAAGLLTARGARTAHAAVVARQLGKVCLVGCTALQIDERTRSIELAGTRLREGDWLTLDGNAGAIYAGQLHVEAVLDEPLHERLLALRAAVAQVPPR